MTDRDWANDMRHENGNHQNRCRACGESFVGLKRRRFCYKCVTRWCKRGGAIKEVGMKLSKRQEKALKTWCRGPLIQYAASKGAEIGPTGTIRSLCKKGLIFEWGQRDLYKLTSNGIEELQRRGFFTPSILYDK